jgi:hypothetical protein
MYYELQKKKFIFITEKRFQPLRVCVNGDDYGVQKPSQKIIYAFFFALVAARRIQLAKVGP